MFIQQYWCNNTIELDFELVLPESELCILTETEIEKKREEIISSQWLNRAKEAQAILSSEHNLKFNTIYTPFKSLGPKCKYLQQSMLCTLCFYSHVYKSV